MTGGRTRDKHGTSRVNTPLFAAIAVLSSLLAACSGANMRLGYYVPPNPIAQQQAELSPQQQREHLRILAAYGGAYRGQRQQAMLDRIVEKLVAASERPDLKYQITMLNSPSVNAFA